MKSLSEHLNEGLKHPKDFSEFEEIYYEKRGGLTTPDNHYTTIKFYVRPSNGGAWTYFGFGNNKLSYFRWTRPKYRYIVKYKDIPKEMLNDIKLHNGEIYCDLDYEADISNFNTIKQSFVPRNKI